MKRVIFGLVLLLASIVAVGSDTTESDSGMIETKHMILYVVDNCGNPTKVFEFTTTGMIPIPLNELLKRGVTQEQIEEMLAEFPGPVVKIQSKKGPCINNI